MPTTTNYSWTTPADTDLVKDGASAIRTLGTAIDTTTKNLNPSTTLGDIEYRSSTANTNTRLGIGTTGQVLTVAGGVPSWATASTYNPDYVLINTGGTALSGSNTVTVSGISNKTDLLIRVDGASMTGGAQLRLRFNSDTGSNYFVVGDQNATSTAQTYIHAGNVPDGANNGDLFLSITATNSTNPKPLYWHFGTNVNTIDFGGGYYGGTSAISSVTFLTDGDNFDAGTAYVYGA